MLVRWRWHRFDEPTKARWRSCASLLEVAGEHPDKDLVRHVRGGQIAFALVARFTGGRANEAAEIVEHLDDVIGTRWQSEFQL